MNQVTELLQLTSSEKQREAIERLRRLFDMMAGQPGFLNAELLVNVERPDYLLVLHRWKDICDWQEFSSSDLKISFTATRPDDLYQFVTCGTNWLLEAARGTEQRTRYVRREVLRGDCVPPAAAVLSETFHYRDYEPYFEGSTLRLTRLDSLESNETPFPAYQVLADETYESLLTSAGAPLAVRGISGS